MVHQQNQLVKNNHMRQQRQLLSSSSMVSTTAASAHVLGPGSSKGLHSSSRTTAALVEWPS
jgi:bisphosphoglycerate-independent phosphoglycerate mutase (AlkP superfamily)